MNYLISTSLKFLAILLWKPKTIFNVERVEELVC